jgi:hypothetical protein
VSRTSFVRVREEIHDRLQKVIERDNPGSTTLEHCDWRIQTDETTTLKPTLKDLIRGR